MKHINAPLVFAERTCNWWTSNKVVFQFNIHYFSILDVNTNLFVASLLARLQWLCRRLHMPGLVQNSTKNNEREVKRHCTCTSRGAWNKAFGDSCPTINFSLSLCQANRREDVAVQQKSLELYPKRHSNLLILLLLTLLAGAALGEFTAFFTIW